MPMATSADPVEHDCEHVIVVSDWTFENPSLA